MEAQYLDSSNTSDSSPASGNWPLGGADWAMQASMNSAAQQGTQAYGRQASGRARPRSMVGARLVPELDPLHQGSIPYEDSETYYTGEQSVSPSSPNTEEQNADSTTGNESSNQEKRRAQNRSAQRAFRIRKIERARNLEKSLMTLLSQHNNLLHSYEEQEGEVKELRNRISNLQSELARLRVSYCQDQQAGGMIVPGQLEDWDFDVFLAPHAASVDMTSEGTENEFKTW